MSGAIFIHSLHKVGGTYPTPGNVLDRVYKTDMYLVATHCHTQSQQPGFTLGKEESAQTQKGNGTGQ